MDAANGGLNMAEIDMTVPTVAPKVGGLYGDRMGHKRGPITRDLKINGYPFQDALSQTGWTGNGRYYAGKWGCHKRDLITIISEPDSVEPDATQETGVVVATVSCEIKSPATKDMGASEYRVDIERDGVFRVYGSAREHGFSASKPAAIAIARAILRMAGESK
jgi:hypothetical protein